MEIKAFKRAETERYYVVEVINELTLTREHIHTEAISAQEAVDLARDRLDDLQDYTIANVFVETGEVWN